MEQLGPAVSRHGLDIHGIGNIKCAHWELLHAGAL